MGIPVCVRLQRCRKVLGVCRFSCDSMTREPSPAFSAFRLSDRGRTVPRIGVCRAYHGSGCAVPTTDRGVPCLPRIGVCRAYHGSGCAVPTTDRGVPCLPRIGMCRARGTLHFGSQYSTGSKKSGRPQHYSKSLSDSTDSNLTTKSLGNPMIRISLTHFLTRSFRYIGFLKQLYVWGSQININLANKLRNI